MPSFEDILNMPASEIKAPEALPVGTYHCLIDGPPTPGKSSQKQTDFLQFKFRILSAQQDVDAAKAVEQQVVGKNFTNDFYITEDAVWRLKEFLSDHLGIEAANGASLKELISQAPGKQVLVKLAHQQSQDGKRVFHRVQSTAHV
jgi:hypothetical protein